MRRFHITIICAVLLFSQGCGAARPSHYYQLNAPVVPNAQPAKTYPVTIVLGSIMTSHLYREDRIVYSSEREQMGTYESERWSEPPVEMLQTILLRNLRSSGNFKDIYPLRSSARGDFVLRGHLFDFKEISGKNFVTRLALEVELHETKSGETVWTHHYTHDEPVNGKDVPSVVASLDANAQRAVAEITNGLVQYFATR